jgi:hypothetical protein
MITCRLLPSRKAASGSFNVHVESAAEQIQDLINLINGLNNPKLRFLLQTLSLIQADVNAGNTALACRDLAGLAVQVQHDQASGTLTAAHASQILADIARIEAVPGC